MTEARIKIVKDGPYLVSGNVPLSEKVIVLKDHAHEYAEGRELPQGESYALCRCGKTKTPPFCDGSHGRIGFDGTETASKDDYDQRIEDKVIGPDLDLLDDGRCAYARFCHRKHGDVWNLTRYSDDPEYRQEAIKAASDCPAGRLVAVEKDGTAIEPAYEPAIEILQDPEKKCSGPIFVKGYIPIESSDGSTYETRNRVTLCRCGESQNMPFCDARHVTARFCDHK